MVWFRGADRVRFLNDLISQEISDLRAGEVRRSMLLGPQGKLEYILWVIAEEDRVGLVTEGGRGELLQATLSRYRIRVEVDIEVETAPRWVVVGDWDGYDISWSTTPRHLVIGDRPDLTIGDLEHYESLRIAAGEPAWALDIDEGAIPQETGLVAVAVDFDKGCFLGQELVARIDSRGGRAPRRLMAVHSSHDIVPGSALLVGEEEVGVVTSAVGGNGLALVERGTETGAVVSIGGVEAAVNDLPDKTPG